MSVFDHFFIRDVDPSLLVRGDYSLGLVALSVGVSMFAATMGLHVAWQSRRVGNVLVARLMRAAGSLALAVGVWAMHFIGMLAFQLCVPVSFDLGVTLLSALPALGASGVALNMLSRPTFHRPHIVVGGALMGAGIGAMHYLGMAAMRMPALLRYDLSTFGLSVAVAVVLSILALGLRYDLAQRLKGRNWLVTTISGVFMGGAISGMHYTGMAAARFVGLEPNKSVGGAALGDPTALALLITLATVLATGLAAGAIAVMRYRQLMLAAAAQTAQLRVVVDTSIDGILVTDGVGRVLMFNAGAEQITGISARAIVGHPVSQVMIDGIRGHAERDFIGFMGRFPVGQSLDTRIRRADGREAAIRLVVGRADTPEGALYVASFTDIGERVRMEKALRQSEQQFRSLIGNIPGIAMRVRVGGGWPLVYISDAVEELTGHPASAMLGQPPLVPLLSIVHPDDEAHVFLQIKQAIKAMQPYVVEFRLRHACGTYRWMWGMGRPLEDEDGIFVDGVLLDINERRDMEEALRRAKQQAEEAMHARSTFMANMSHEIRTPMNAIIGFTEVALASQLDAEVRQHLLTVRTAARSLLVLLNDVLDSSKLERGAVELENLPYELRQLIQQVADEQALSARRKGLVLQVTVADGVPRRVMGDPHRVRQVLVNLLGNALKFTEHGKVELGARIADDGRLRLWVRDTGIGIAPERIERIFDPFTQADPSMSRRFGGTGLGTTISRQLVELMGGRIWAESVLGEGSIFQVDLPCDPADAQESDFGELVAEEDNSSPAQRVLVVDDAADNAELLGAILEADGHQAELVDNGEAALARYIEGGIDVILMDLVMPGMDGFEVARRIREEESRRNLARVPVIALSATRRPDTMQAVEAAGMDGFLHKPVDPASVAAELKRVHQVVRPSIAQPKAGQTHELLDASKGRQRWGDDVSWAQALAQFCRHKRDWLRNVDPDTPPPAQQALAEAHRFRGVAASLSMPALARAAADLEGHIQHKLPLSDVWLRLSQVVSRTVGAAQAEWEALRVAQTAGEPSAPGALEGAGLDDEQWRLLLRGMVTSLRQGEHPEGPWQVANAQGSSRFGGSAWAALSQAIDDFDFDTAADRAEAFLEQLRDTVG